ncbi:MAG TPA: hypothetical protein EYG94_06115 [Campylobacterales bacterium]|nr:hypothetical protein [Campylobacterales bacterium]
MTIQQVSFRDFIRGYIPADILLLLDKKTKTKKGLFVTQEYADDVLAFIEQREQEKKEKKKRALLDFVGEFGESQKLSTASHQEIKASKYE